MKFQPSAFKRPTDPYLRKRRLRRLAAYGALALGAVLAVAAALFAVRGINQARGERPKRADLLALWEAADYTSLSRACDLVLEQSPLDSYALVFKGFSSFYAGSSEPESSVRAQAMDDAVGQLRKALTDSECPLLPQARYVLGKAYYAKGRDYWDLSLAELDLASALGYAPDDSWEYRALSAYGSGQVARSLGYFTEALARFPDSAELSLAAARAWADSGDWAKAESLASAAAGSTADEYLLERADFLIAEAAMAAGRPDEARARYAAIIARNPESAEAWYQDGLILSAQGDLMGARASWRKAVSIDPMHAPARQKLAERS